MSTFLSSRRFRWWLVTAALYWMLFLVLRLVFVLVFLGSSGEVPVPDFITALSIGIRFDLRLALLLTLPLALLALVPYVNLLRFRMLQSPARWYFTLSILLLLLFYTVDLAHYGYLEKRFDVTTLRFLANPLISLQMIWESYPVIGGLLALAGGVFVWDWLYRKLAWKWLGIMRAAISRKQAVLGGILSFLVFLFGCWGTFSQYALRWSDAFFTQDPYISAVGLNPVLYFNDTRKFRSADYDPELVRRFYPLTAEYLRVTGRDSGALSFVRDLPGRPGSGTAGIPPNVVIIILESVGTNRLGMMGNPFDPTPHLDRLIARSLFFDRFYIPIVGTARSVFGLVTGIPDIARVETSSRNPLIIEQTSILNALEGYDKYYFLGGSASWANIRGLLRSNIPDIRLVELGDFSSSRVDVWGISDHDLFREAHARLEKESRDRPFLAVIQTATNHKPYSIPGNVGDFVVRDEPAGDLRSAGFKSPAQYNGMRLLDHAVGEYFRLVEGSGYGDNTLFVLFADHGTSDPPARHMPAADYELALRSFNVPLIMHGPHLIPRAQRISTVCGLVDVLPTVAGLVGIPYRNQTLGRDILRTGTGELALALLSDKKHAHPRIGVIGADFYLSMYHDGEDIRLHDLHSMTPGEDVSTRHPEITERYARMTRALYETAKYLLAHNRGGD